jgi:Holliday junction resolvase RusA-like endonuclease
MTETLSREAFRQLQQKGQRSATFTLPLAPSVNGLYATAEDGQRVKTKAARKWRKQAVSEISRQARGICFAGTFRLSVLASDQGLVRDRDCDNLGKAIADALTQSGVITDDNHRHMRAITLEWSHELPAGSCTATVIELSPEPLPKPTAALRRKAKDIPARILAGLQARGICVSAKRIHLQ